MVTTETLRALVEHEARSRGDKLGWRLLASPASVLSHSEIAFIGLNPGGKMDVPEHGRLTPFNGSAYVTESWAGFPAGQSPLQKQVRHLFVSLDVAPEAVLAGNLVPFRSPSWSALRERPTALEFGEKLWRDIIEASQPKLVITMSGLVFNSVRKMLKIENVERTCAGWGNVALRFGQSSDIRIVGLPHLSRFPLLRRPASAEGLSKAFASYWKPPMATPGRDMPSALSATIKIGMIETPPRAFEQ